MNITPITNITLTPLTFARRMSRRRIRQIQRTMRLSRTRACLVAKLLAARPVAVIALLFIVVTLAGCGGNGTNTGIPPTPCAVTSFDQGHDCAVVQFPDGGTYRQVGK